MKKLNVICCKDHDHLGRVTAELLAEEIRRNPNLVLGLPTGQTPIPVYQHLRRIYDEGNLDCSGVTTVNLDEYLLRGEGDPDSYITFMQENLFNHIPFKASYLPNAKPENYEQMSETELTSALNNNCSDYDAILEELGVDIQVLGLGTNTHVAFNEPSDKWTEGTYITDLTAQTLSDNADKFYDGDINAVPKKALSMGMKQIMKAKSIILIANGDAKAEAVSRSLYGEVSPQIPASLLRKHENVTFIIDEAAAKLL